jgi:hypothetical protein
VVRQLEDVKIIKIFWSAEARVVLIIKRHFNCPSEVYMEKITVLLEKYFIQKRNACHIHNESEDPLTKHLSLCFSCFTSYRELSNWDDFAKNLIGG